MKNEQGLTLIEMMVVVVIIGILSGITINLLNISKQKARATDAKSLSNLQKTSSAIEAYYYGEGSYPLPADSGNPFDNELNTGLSTYLTNTWSADFRYISNGSAFAVLVLKEEDGNYYKYISSEARIMECDAETPNIKGSVVRCNEVSEEL